MVEVSIFFFLLLTKRLLLKVVTRSSITARRRVQTAGNGYPNIYDVLRSTTGDVVCVGAKFEPKI